VQLEGEDDVSAERYNGSTVSQTCFNLVRTGQGPAVWSAQLRACCRLAMSVFYRGLLAQINVFMGIGLLSCPYAMRLSGWAGLLALAGATCLFCLSGKLIVAGFKKIPANMPQTYPALGMPISSALSRASKQCV